MSLNPEKLRPHTLNYGTSNIIVRCKTRVGEKEGLISAHFKGFKQSMYKMKRVAFVEKFRLL